jgi:hypothetical protein
MDSSAKIFTCSGITLDRVRRNPRHRHHHEHLMISGPVKVSASAYDFFKAIGKNLAPPEPKELAPRA